MSPSNRWKNARRLLVCCLVFFAPSTWAWNAAGHELVGEIADSLLEPSVRQQIGEVLGSDVATLRAAAPWADCLRGVVLNGDHFEYRPKSPFDHTPECAVFVATEKSRMTDFAGRNWGRCIIPPIPDSQVDPFKTCLSQYHFANIPVQRGRYDRGDAAGASNHDVVATIEAAITVLRTGQAPAPFSIGDRKEAVMLLAHMVGDVHQPLHVGAVFLAKNGAPIEPSEKEAPSGRSDTWGGNRLIDGPDKAPNLHSEWDSIPKADDPSTITAARLSELTTAARAIPPTSGDPGTWADRWADETVTVAGQAFNGLTFGARTGSAWHLTTSPYDYVQRRGQLQEQQVVKAGARLAQLLNALFATPVAAIEGQPRAIADAADQAVEFALRWFPSEGGPADAAAVGKLIGASAPQDEDKLVVRYFTVKPAGSAPAGAIAILRARNKSNNKKFQLMFKIRTSTDFPTSAALCPLTPQSNTEELSDKAEWDLSWVGPGHDIEAFSYSCTLKSEAAISIPAGLGAQQKSPTLALRRTRFTAAQGEVTVEEWTLPGNRTVIEVSRSGVRTHPSREAFGDEIGKPILGAGALPIPESMTKLAMQPSP